MYRLKWDDGETEYYALKNDLMERMYFLQRYCGYVYGRDFFCDRILDGITMSAFDEGSIYHES